MVRFAEAGMQPINYYLSSINYYLKYGPAVMGGGVAVEC